MSDLKKIILLTCIWSHELYANKTTTIYVSNCNACYNLCDNNSNDETKTIINCQCGGISTLPQGAFSTSLVFSDNCGNSTCDFDELQNIAQKTMNTCTYTTVTQDENDSQSNNAINKNNKP